MKLQFAGEKGTEIFEEFFQRNKEYKVVEDLSAKPNRFRSAKIKTNTGIKFLKMSVNECFNKDLELEIQTLVDSSVRKILTNNLILPDIITTNYFKSSKNIYYKIRSIQSWEGEQIPKIKIFFQDFSKKIEVFKTLELENADPLSTAPVNAVSGDSEVGFKKYTAQSPTQICLTSLVTSNSCR